ncbi:sodium-extruding oxaloacetate decarboxylase subunit alpha [Salmonella enterica]|nr:oxaloacetate decarboxylase subunit alpha [Salmonella enterica subsp. enterica serovar Dublin]
MTIAITDVVLRDAHQSLFATRLRLDDMLPIAAALDDVGYGSLECWGGATFDACIRFLGEDPWLRLRELKKAMPKTPLQMLLRGQNLLGYRHYADDVVERFVERAVKNGMDVFRVFDAMNDPRNMKAALQAVRSHGAHAQGTLSYTTSPAHTLQTWLDLTEQLLETGVDSIAIKDMSGILTPMAAYELVSEIKKRYDVRLHLHCHATTGMAEMALLKAIEAGVDGVDTAISSMSATYGHPATEALVATLAGTEHDTGLDILKLENIAAYFREVRKKYHAFEGQLKGYDSRILVAQVPGGMLTNLESQLKQQNAADKLDQVLAEIPRVREDLGFIPLVTPTSQIVGTQAVLNVLTGERYKTIAITDVVLRDAHQSLFATRLRLDDMLPIAAALDDVGYGSLECWGGATFDACIRFLGEDPWLRLRELKKAMPKTPLQMLLRGQNLLGYRHYADDVVERFVERAVKNGMDVFRVFDAMNDPRNMKAALQAVRSHGAHAQGTLSYTTSPAHTLQTWLDLTEQLLETGVDSIAIKDMSGILTPMAAYELVSEIKKRYDVRLHLHCHATTGMAEMALLKAIEAGVDGVDTAISSMSATYGHPATEALVATLAGTEHDTGLDILKLENIAAYFREVRKKYHAFEGQLKGYDSRILVAQVPGGMLTNLESQLKQQNAADKLDQVLAEIPRVREDLGFIPLVTPTSQIVGTQAVLNVLTGERYKTIAKETAGILKGEYGHTPVPVNAALQARVLEGGAPVTCRPADLLKPELAELEADVRRQAQEKGIQLAGNAIDDVLTVALFPQIGLKFLENRHNPAAFEPLPQAEAAQPVAKAEKPAASGIYTVEVEGKAFVVKVSDGGDISQLTAASSAPVQAASPVAPAGAGTPVTAPLAGNIWKVIAAEGQTVAEGDVLLILEAMKMETEIRAAQAGTVRGIAVKSGDAVSVGDTLMTLA